MDSVLANSQANLAYKQRELAKLTEFQLPQNPHLNLGEKHHYHETEELFKITRDLKNDLDSRNNIPLSDPVAQIQQKKIQMLIAERQYTVAESQIRIIQGYILNGMENDPTRSGLSRIVNMKTTDELQKQAQPLLTEASELLKKARHSVTFAELGARQRMGSLIMQQQQQRNSIYGEAVVDEVDLRHCPTNFHRESFTNNNPLPPTPRPQSPSPPPYSPTHHYQEYTEHTVPVPAEPYHEQTYRRDQSPSERGTLQDADKEDSDKNDESGCCCSKCCIISFITLLVVCLIAGGVIYALIAYDVIKF